MTEAELARFRAGDPEIFRTLVERESPRLLAYATRLTGDADAAQDLVQDCWVRAFRKRRSFQRSGTLLGWLIAICRSNHLSSRRLRARRESKTLDVEESSTHPTPEASAVTLLERAEIRHRIADAVGELPDRERDVLVLRLVEELSTRETAVRMGIAEGTVKAALFKAIRKLRPMLEELT
jgi:RNA polymerase sigma-70 factor, ECF subfamily